MPRTGLQTAFLPTEMPRTALKAAILVHFGTLLTISENNRANRHDFLPLPGETGSVLSTPNK
jgi:hypothetical protein